MSREGLFLPPQVQELAVLVGLRDPVSPLQSAGQGRRADAPPRSRRGQVGFRGGLSPWRLKGGSCEEQPGGAMHLPQGEQGRPELPYGEPPAAVPTRREKARAISNKLLIKLSS